MEISFCIYSEMCSAFVFWASVKYPGCHAQLNSLIKAVIMGFQNFPGLWNIVPRFPWWSCGLYVILVVINLTEHFLPGLLEVKVMALENGNICPSRRLELSRGFGLKHASWNFVEDKYRSSSWYLNLDKSTSGFNLYFTCQKNHVRTTRMAFIAGMVKQYRNSVKPESDDISGYMFHFLSKSGHRAATPKAFSTPVFTIEIG